MFAFAAAPPTAAEMARFAQLLPLPDLVVYVRSSVATMDARTRRRADPPRQINAQYGDWWEAYIRAAVALFDALVQSAPLRDRCLIIENPDCTRPEYDALVEGLAQAILNRRPLPRRPGLAPPRSSAPWETYAQANPPAH